MKKPKLKIEYTRIQETKRKVNLKNVLECTSFEEVLNKLFSSKVTKFKNKIDNIVVSSNDYKFICESVYGNEGDTIPNIYMQDGNLTATCKVISGKFTCVFPSIKIIHTMWSSLGGGQKLDIK